MRAAIDWKKGVDLFFTDKAQQRATRLTMLVLLVLLAVVLAQWTWKLLPSGPEADAPLPVSSPVTSRQGAAGTGTDRQWNLSQWHLFGVMPDDARLEQVAVESLPETTLNLTLRGVVAAAQNGRESGAIIGVPNGVDTFYPIDASLPGGATLKEVYPDRVVLERAGRLETLRLPKELLENTGAGGGQADIRSSGSGRSLREYRDLALSNPQQLGNVVNVSPRSEGGQFIGYEVQPGQDPGLLDRVGLNPGDVVTSVNGISLDTPARALSVLRSLRETDQINVDFQRDGVPRSLTVNIP